MPRYVEFKCTNLECNSFYTIWEAYVSIVDDYDGGYEYVAHSDGPATPLLTNVCPECGEQGEEL